MFKKRANVLYANSLRKFGNFSFLRLKILRKMWREIQDKVTRVFITYKDTTRLWFSFVLSSWILNEFFNYCSKLVWTVPKPPVVSGMITTSWHFLIRLVSRFRSWYFSTYFVYSEVCLCEMGRRHQLENTFFFLVQQNYVLSGILYLFVRLYF